MLHQSLEAIANLLPFAIMIAAWLYFVRQFRGKDGLTQGQYMTAILAETKKQNELMAKTLDTMNRRLERLEDADRNNNART